MAQPLITYKVKNVYGGNVLVEHKHLDEEVRSMLENGIDPTDIIITVATTEDFANVKYGDATVRG